MWRIVQLRTKYRERQRVLSAEFLHHGTGLAKYKVKFATMVLRCDKISSYNQDSVWSWFICFCTTIRMMLTTGFTFALGVLFPVLMDSFKETREKTGEFHTAQSSKTQTP